MLRHVVLCCVMLCHVVLCCAMLRHVVLCCAMMCYVGPCCVMVCYVVSCCVMLCYVVSCCVMLCYVVPCCVMLCHVVLCSAMLCHVVLCCALLFNVVPCFAMLCHVVLGCVVLCHVVLCCAMLCQKWSCSWSCWCWCILKCVTEYPGIKAVWLQKLSFTIRSGQIQNYLSAVRLTAVVSQIRCNNGCMNRWKSGYSKFVSLKPLSQQNPFLSLKVQASSEIIWFEMLYRRDHRTLRRLSLCTFRFHEIEPSLCTFLLFRTIISP